MGLYILYAILILGFALLFKVVYDSDKRYKWFMKLKPGDKILVKIYSFHCDCGKEATVTKESDGKYIGAEVVDIERCKGCAEINSRNKAGEITCWYNVTMFKKGDVGKIKEK